MCNFGVETKTNKKTTKDEDTHKKENKKKNPNNYYSVMIIIIIIIKIRKRNTIGRGLVAQELEDLLPLVLAAVEAAPPPARSYRLL